MNRIIIKNSILALVILSFLLDVKLLLYVSTGLLFLLLITNSDERQQVFKIIRTKYFWLISIISWLSLFGMINTSQEHFSEGLKYLERLIFIVVLPPILIVAIKEMEFEKFLKILKASVVIIFVSGIINSTLVYLSTSDHASFYNNNLLSLFSGQAVYYSLYVCLVLIINLFRLRVKSFNKNELTQESIFLIICLTYLILLSSRLSLVLSSIIIFTSFYYLFQNKLSKQKLLIILVFILTSFISLGYFLSDTVINRFKSLSNTKFNITNLEEEYHFQTGENKTNWNGVTIRLAIWKCALDVIHENPIIGVGTGDYKSALRESFQKKGFQYGILKNYGSHNQYLYLLITHGVVGLSIFLLVIIYLLIDAYRKGNYLLIFTLLIFGVAFMTENIFNKLFGVFIWALFVSSTLVFNINLYNKDSSTIK